jgi:hypothetical protein
LGSLNSDASLQSILDAAISNKTATGATDLAKLTSMLLNGGLNSGFVVGQGFGNTANLEL